jgi:protein subunit release factor A
VVRAVIIDDEDIEVHAYSTLARSRGGQQCGTEPGVIVIHRPTGITIVDRSERSQIMCRLAAYRKLQDVLNLLEVADVLDTFSAE